MPVDLQLESSEMVLAGMADLRFTTQNGWRLEGSQLAPYSDAVQEILTHSDTQLIVAHDPVEQYVVLDDPTVIHNNSVGMYRVLASTAIETPVLSFQFNPYSWFWKDREPIEISIIVKSHSSDGLLSAGPRPPFTFTLDLLSALDSVFESGVYPLMEGSQYVTAFRQLYTGYVKPAAAESLPKLDVRITHNLSKEEVLAAASTSILVTIFLTARYYRPRLQITD